MHRFALFLGMGTALVAANACGRGAVGPVAAAATRDDTDEVRRLIREGHPADERDPRFGITALMDAARVGAVNAMAVLLDAGANPNARDDNTRWTPLLHAIHKQQPDAVRLLLDRGADPNLASPANVTPLLMAADDPNPAIVSSLLEHGANPRVEGPGGMTPLTQAVSGGALTDVTDRPLLGGCHPATVRALLAHDPGLTLPSTFAGRQALWWARFHDCEEVLRLIGATGAGVAHQVVAGAGLVRDAVTPAKPKKPTAKD